MSLLQQLCTGYIASLLALSLMIIFSDGQTFPSKSPTTSIEASFPRQSCGTNQWCYYNEISPTLVDATSDMVRIIDTDKGVETFFDAHFHITNNPCLNPQLTFWFYPSSAAYFEVYDLNTSSLIQRCDNNCDSFDMCFIWLPLSTSYIEPGSTYSVRVTDSATTNTVCTNDTYSVSADLILTCEATPSPTADTAAPTLSPTTAAPTFPPTLAPTLPPSMAPSSAPSKAPSAAPTWSPTANVLTISNALKLNGTIEDLTCGVIFNKQTTKDTEFRYFRLNISELTPFPKTVATTCCSGTPDAVIEIINGVEYELTVNESTYCKDNSLDTVLYLIKQDEKTNTISVVERNDDSTSGVCSDNGRKYGKSAIDLTEKASSLETGDGIAYYIAVGGLTTDSVYGGNGYQLDAGTFQLELICDDYVYPLTPDQFLANTDDSNSHNIACGQTLRNQQTLYTNLVQYYYFNITEDTPVPIVVSVCDQIEQYSSYATYVYVASIQYYRQQASGFTVLKTDTFSYGDPASGETTYCNLDISTLDEGRYIIAVAGFSGDDNQGSLQPGQFSMKLSCGIPPEPLDVAALVLVISVIALAVLLVCIAFLWWYCKELKKAKRQRDEERAKTQHLEIDEHVDAAEIEERVRLRASKGGAGHPIDVSRDTELAAMNIAAILAEVEDEKQGGDKKQESSKGSVGVAGLSEISEDSAVVESNEDVNVDAVSPRSKRRNDRLERRDRVSIGGTQYLSDFDEDGHIKGLRLEEDDIEEHPDMDMIVAVMRDVIASCEDEEGLDVYQVLAFRRLDEKSQKLKLFKPLEKVGIEYEILNFSPYQRALFNAFVVSFLQGVGITIILYSVTYEFFADDDNNHSCSWQGEDWAESWMFKILAFFWAIVITLSIASALRALKKTGFNQVIGRVDSEQYAKLDVIDVGVVYFGFIVNLYTLLLAVFGSYFLIYSSEGGAGAIDMVLNAVALFFMIEVDDILVTHHDYNDVGEGTDEFLLEYLNKLEEMDPEEDEEETDEDKASENGTKQWFGPVGLHRLSKGASYLSGVIEFMTISGGLLAPLVIFVCYGD